MNTVTKKVFALLLAMAMMFSLAACGGDDADAEGGEEKPVYEVLTEATFPPFDTVDEEGNIIGFDMDLIAAIGEDQGFDVEFTDMSFASLIPALQAGNGDIIAAGMWADDPERIALVDFSDVYYTNKNAFVVKNDNPAESEAELLSPDIKVAAQIGSCFADWAMEWQDAGQIQETVILDGYDTCMLQLVNGDVQAVYMTYVNAVDYAAKYADQTKVIVGESDEKHKGNNVAFAVQKGNTELAEKINTGLQNLKDNGTYDELVKKWNM